MARSDVEKQSPYSRHVDRAKIANSRANRSKIKISIDMLSTNTVQTITGKKGMGSHTEVRDNQTSILGISKQTNGSFELNL